MGKDASKTEKTISTELWSYLAKNPISNRNASKLLLNHGLPRGDSRFRHFDSLDGDDDETLSVPRKTRP